MLFCAKLMHDTAHVCTTHVHAACVCATCARASHAPCAGALCAPCGCSLGDAHTHAPCAPCTHVCTPYSRSLHTTHMHTAHTCAHARALCVPRTHAPRAPMAPGTFVHSPDPRLVSGDSPLVAVTCRFMQAEEYLHTYQPTTSTLSNIPSAPHRLFSATPQQQL